MGATTISWCDHSINPIRARHHTTDRIGHYCEKVSAGCKNCYSSRLQSRFGMPPFEAPHQRDVEPFFDRKRLKEVLHRKKPTRYFWCDMTDMFGAWVSDDWLDDCLAVMALTPQHTHMLLTKRPEHMYAYFMGNDEDLQDRAHAIGATIGDFFDQPALRLNGEPLINKAHGFAPDDEDCAGRQGEQTLLPLPSVWLGVSCEDQATADARIPWLLKTPAARRFVSYEPALAAVDFRPFLAQESCDHTRRTCQEIGCWGKERLDWIICGGESGPSARPFDVEWAMRAREQCREAKVHFFMKQYGSNPYYVSEFDRAYQIALKDRKGADPAEWPEGLRVQQFPQKAAHA